MTDEQEKLLLEFWTFVSRAEAEIWESRRQHWSPGHNDSWDPAFGSAYDAIKPCLVRFAKERPFDPPKVPGQAPYSAETAHQALLFFLTPPDALYGLPGVLDSREYLDIKGQAHEEFSQLLAQRRRTKKFDRKRKPKTSQDEFLLKVALFQKHNAEYEEGKPNVPFTQPQLEELLGWKQSRVSRTMADVFKGGMKEYKARCKSGRINKGLFNPRTGQTEAIQPEEEPPEGDETME